MNKTTLGVLVLIVLALGGGYYLWSMNADTDTQQTAIDTEAGASGRVIDSSESVPETADLEAELNDTGADTDADMQQLEAEFEASN